MLRPSSAQVLDFTSRKEEIRRKTFHAFMNFPPTLPEFGNRKYGGSDMDKSTIAAIARTISSIVVEKLARATSERSGR